jgi:DNA-binding winged helix-turn-helix (wHTH) protein
VTFDSDTRQLLRDGAEVHVSPKAFDLLKILIDHRPRVLSRQQLHEHLWPETFVADSNLASLIAELREALGDSARRPVFIRTAYRFGYAFCGEAAISVPEPGHPVRPPIYCWLVMKGRRVALQPGENVLGRDMDVIDIQSPTVSRLHARIVVSDTEVLLEDLGSKNGTFVCGHAVSGAVVRLTDGDEIRTGSVVFHFRMTPRTGATATWSGAEATGVGSASERRHPVEDDSDAG